jgi:hypothetical protein
MIGAALIVLVLAVGTETADFTRYQTIIDRSPFGQVLGAGTVVAAPWLASWQYVGNAVSNSGNGLVQAIIANKENNHWFFRAEGETLEGGITIVKIDRTQNPPKLVLKNGLETGTLSFPERTAVAAAAPAPPNPIGLPGMTPPQPPGATPNRRIPFQRVNR